MPNNKTTITFKTTGNIHEPYGYDVKDVAGTKKLQPNSKLQQVIEFITNIFALMAIYDIEIIVTTTVASIKIVEDKYLENIKCLFQPISPVLLSHKEMTYLYYRFTKELSVAEIMKKFGVEESICSTHFKSCLNAYNIGNKFTPVQKVIKMLNIWNKYYLTWIDPFEFTGKSII